MNKVTYGHATSYRCHVGHAYGPMSLLDAQAAAAEAALWTALASLEEQAAVHGALAEEGHDLSQRDEHRQRAEQITQQARELRRLLRVRARA